MSPLRSIFHEKGLLILAGLLFFLTALFPAAQALNRKDYISPPLDIQYLSSGFRTQMSDSFWIRAVQDIDFCDQPVNSKECKGESWLFHVVNLTTELDHHFVEAYYYGALALTVIVSDIQGASIIFDKAVQEFPDNWHILYTAAYQAAIEEKNSKKAADLYLRAAEHGAPGWTRLLAGRLLADSGEQPKAKEILKKMIEQEQDPQWIKKLQDKIESERLTQ